MLVYVKIKNKIEQCLVKKEDKVNNTLIILYNSQEITILREDVLGVQLDTFNV